MKKGRVQITQELLKHQLGLDDFGDMIIYSIGMESGDIELYVASTDSKFPGEELKEGETPPMIVCKREVRLERL